MVSKKQDLKQQPFVKLKTTQEPSSESIGQTHQSIVTLNSLPETNSEQMEFFRTSSSEDTPVNRSVSQVVKEAKKTKDISGQKCIDLYESCGLDGSFAKMLVDTLNSVSTKYSLHWRLKDTPSGRLLFQRAVSMPRTKETGSGLWLTPTAVQTDEHPDKMKERMAKYPNGTTVGSLTSQVKYAPSQGGTPLPLAVRTSETDGQLNPTWVEWLMGFPTGHTELKHWVTRSSRKSQKR